MGFATCFGQGDLFLALAEPGFLILGGFIGAVVATDAFLVFRAGLVGGQDRAAAGKAKLVRAFLQSVANRYALIKDEAFALPLAFIWRNSGASAAMAGV